METFVYTGNVVVTQPRLGNDEGRGRPVLSSGCALRRVLCSGNEVGVDQQKTSQNNPGKLIAIVEDDPSLADLFYDVLNQANHDGRWHMHVFTDGQDAKNRLPELGAHLILLDVGLPNLDGASLYKILRGHSNTKNTPIIVITGSHDWELHRMGLQTGLLLHKPFNVQELLFMISALLDPPSTTLSEESRSADPGHGEREM